MVDVDYFPGKTWRCLKTVEKVSEWQDSHDIIHTALIPMAVWRCEGQVRSSLWRKLHGTSKLWRSLASPDRKMLIAGGPHQCKKWTEQPQNRRGQPAGQCALWDMCDSHPCGLLQNLFDSTRLFKFDAGNKMWLWSWTCINKLNSTRGCYSTLELDCLYRHTVRMALGIALAQVNPWSSKQCCVLFRKQWGQRPFTVSKKNTALTVLKYKGV